MLTSRSGSAGHTASSPPQSIEAVRRRARHRLIGAAVLVLVGVLGFPLLFDTQPRPMAVDVRIEIPSRNTPATPAPKTEPPAAAKPAPVATAGSLAAREEVVEPKAAAKPADKPVEKPAEKPQLEKHAADKAVAEKATEKPPENPSDKAATGNERIVVQVGAGLTTTGATVFEGLDGYPVSINFWRCQLVWLGGMGLIVLAVAILPLLDIGGRQMFKAETPGPMKDSKMTPRIAETAKGLWVVYTLISVCCVLGYGWAGMTWLDAIMHMFTTMGLGGFSSHDASVGFFDSPAIEAVSIVFMLIAGCNFATHYVVLSGRSLRPYASDPEPGLA